MRIFHSRSFPFPVLFLLVATSFSASAATAVEVEARLVAPAGSESELKATVTAEVRALPVAVGQPVNQATVLVEMNVEKLQKELEGLRKELKNAQDEKRRLAVQRGATSSSPASNSRVDMANAAAVSDAQMAESNAISDLARVQSELATADLRAPADGYIARQLYAVGAKAKKRKPLLAFVEARKTVLEAAVPAGEAGPFIAGANVQVTAATTPALAFRGKVLSATPQGDTVALRIQPLELPYLALDVAAPARLSVTP